MLSSYANDAKETNKGHTIELMIPSWQLGELAVKLHYGTSWIVTEYGSSDDRENDADLCACGCCCRRRGKWSQVGGKDVPPSPVCLPASLSACLPPLPASFLDASGWSDSECCSPPLSLSLSLSLLLSFSVCLGLAWLGSARIQSLLPWATIEIMDFMCHKLLLMQQSNIYDDNSRWQWWR